MSYTPTEWATGDVVTAPKLNNIEDELVKLDKTFRLTFKSSDGTYDVIPVYSLFYARGTYIVKFATNSYIEVNTENDVTLLFNCKDADSILMNLSGCIAQVGDTPPILEGDGTLQGSTLTLNGDATITFAGTPEADPE